MSIDKYKKLIKAIFIKYRVCKNSESRILLQSSFTPIFKCTSYGTMILFLCKESIFGIVDMYLFV